MRNTSIILAALLATACTGEITDSVTTDFGDAVATSERTEDGDIESRLTSPDQRELLALMDWRADSGELFGEIDTQSIQVDGAMQMDAVPIEELNLLLYNLWEIERQAPAVATCVSNQAILCCRDSAWSCRARN